MTFSKNLLASALASLLPFAAMAANSDNSSIADAAKGRDQATVETLIKQRADVNTAQPDGTSALTWAAHWDDLKTADLLLRAGANANAENDYGVTPLSVACTNGSAQMVTRLLDAGAKPNAELVRTGETPLMTCARSGNAAAVESLLTHGANVNVAEKYRGQTALMWAVAQRHPEAAQSLIKHGADVRVRSKSGFTALLFAARAGDVDSARSLLEAGADINESTPADGSALVVAAASGQEKIGIFLVEKGASTSITDAYGFTALHYAVQKGISDLSAVEYNASLTPSKNLPELVNALLAHGADPNARITKDYEPFTRAPYRHSVPMSLIGATPYFLAAAAGDAGIMRALIAAKADPKLMVKGNTTALMVAAGMGRYLNDFLDVEEEKNALEAVKTAVENGADVNAVNDKGQNALHAAAFTGVSDIVQFLVDKGASVNAADKVGQTPWSIASAISPRLEAVGSLRLHQNAADLLFKLGAKKITEDDFVASSRARDGKFDYEDPAAKKAK